MEVHSLGKRHCRVRNIPSLYGVDVLIALEICPDAPTYSHPQCLGERWVDLSFDPLGKLPFETCAGQFWCVLELLIGDLCVGRTRQPLSTRPWGRKACRLGNRDHLGSERISTRASSSNVCQTVTLLIPM